MAELNILTVSCREQFREWLTLHAAEESECWVAVKRGRPIEPDSFYYIDAVEEALCFGWIDSIQKPINGVRMQRFSPRKKNSPWTELNKERVRAYNVAFYKTRDRDVYERSLAHLIEKTKAGEMFGEWDNYGRLLE